MILLAAVLVLAAIGLLAAGLIEGSATLQWASFAASALAAVIVVTGEVRRNLAARREADPAGREPAGRRADRLHSDQFPAAGPPSRPQARQQPGQPYDEPYDEAYEEPYGEPRRYDEPYGGSGSSAAPAYDQPHDDRPHADQASGTGSYDDRPYADRPFADQGDASRSYDDRPYADRSYADQPDASGSYDQPYTDQPYTDRPYTDRPFGAQPYQATDAPSSGAQAAQPPYDLTPPAAGPWDRPPHELFDAPWDGARQPAGATAYEPPPYVPPPTPPADDDTSLLAPATADPVRYGTQDGGSAQPPPAIAADGEPPVEEVEVTDLLVVLDLQDEVLVVDEHPRYHLAGCPHVNGEVTFAMPMVEARTDGFTPCATCAPDRNLARVERARRSRGQAPSGGP